MQTAAPDSLVGRTLEGRYRILDRIARGGMSTVYSAVDERLDRLVAVKVMSAALSADPAFIDRFSREARAAARLAHVNAVAVYDQGQDDTDGHHVFLVMELVEGRTLRDLIRERGGRFTPAEAISIMEPVLAALAAAHRAGLVHRDIKPENILLSDDGLVKVADFGLARALDSDVASTRTGLMMGTVAYCAPEQIVQGRADQRSDVYAAGIVLFELLTGRPPYSGDSAMNVAYQHVHSRVPAPSSRINGIPNEIDELVINATDTDPTSRPADAGAFLAEIAEIRADLNLPITAIPARSRDSRNTTALVPPVRPMGADTSRTDILDGPEPRYDTRVVPQGRAPMPPPGAGMPSKQPPRGRPLSAKQRKRRRAWIGLAVVIFLALASVIGGMKAVDWYHTWDTHVPKVVGESKAQALDVLRQHGYPKVTIAPADPAKDYSDTVPAGDVLAMSPSPGSRLDRGKTVTLTISLGVHNVTIPNVKNMTVDLAEATLREKGIQFGPTPVQATSATVTKGLAIGTDPATGRSIRFGATVSLIVSSGPQMVTLPQLQPNESFADYSAALTAAKFVVDRQGDTFSPTVPSGDVVSVAPDPRTTSQAALGSTVKVTVSKGPKMATIPDFGTGTKLKDVETELDQLGIKYTVQRTGIPGLGNRFISSNPTGGTSVPVGSTITLYVF